MHSVKKNQKPATEKLKTNSTSGHSVKKTTEFKQKNKGGKPPGNRSGKGAPARLSRAEEARLDLIREQSERKAEREAKKMQHQKQQKRKTKILAKKNKKGQPVMGGRMQLLLEKIEKRLS